MEVDASRIHRIVLRAGEKLAAVVCWGIAGLAFGGYWKRTLNSYSLANREPRMSSVQLGGSGKKRGTLKARIKHD